MSLEGFLQEREARQAGAAGLAERDAKLRAWLRQDAPIEERLLKFDAWVNAELATRLDWAWAGEAKARRIAQCRIELEGLIVQLWQRGWMLDGKALAKHVQAALDDVAKAQAAGRVKEFWPFFQAVAKRYVGVNAEGIQTEAMSLGAAVAGVFERALKNAPSIVEGIAQRRDETIRAKQQAARKKEAAKVAEASQPTLF